MELAGSLAGSPALFSPSFSSSNLQWVEREGKDQETFGGRKKCGGEAEEEESFFSVADWKKAWIGGVFLFFLSSFLSLCCCSLIIINFSVGSLLKSPPLLCLPFYHYSSSSSFDGGCLLVLPPLLQVLVLHDDDDSLPFSLLSPLLTPLIHSSSGRTELEKGREDEGESLNPPVSARFLPFPPILSLSLHRPTDRPTDQQSGGAVSPFSPSFPPPLSETCEWNKVFIACREKKR